MVVYQCEDSLESIFTAVYDAYEQKRSHSETRISLTEEQLLFEEYIPVQADDVKAIKVIRSLRRKFGEEDYRQLCYALASPEEDKAQAVYQTIVYGLSHSCAPGHLLDNLANDAVNRTFRLARGAWNECHHLFGFLRFQELENGILYAKIGSKNNLVTFLMPHFADRFPMENFIIYDENRDIFALHPAGKEWYLVRGRELAQYQDFSLSEKEQEYQELFRYFCHKIAIKERKNLALQRNLLPLRFQEYMIEFDKNCQKYNLGV